MTISDNKNEQWWITEGLEAAKSTIFYQDKIWSIYSNDKIDISLQLFHVLRSLFKKLPLSTHIRALSIGSGYEPQFQILQAACEDHTYLLDTNLQELEKVKSRIHRQAIQNVSLLHIDYKVFMDSEKTERFLKTKLENKPVNLICLHHSLYYSRTDEWHVLIRNLYRILLASTGAIHCVLMACKSNDPQTTTWLYDHFTERFFNHHNDQDLFVLKNHLYHDPLFDNKSLISKTTKVSFFVDNFRKFMAVVWMILLYPSVHQYSLEQKKEIIHYIYHNFFSLNKPILQNQNHLIIYKIKND